MILKCRVNIFTLYVYISEIRLSRISYILSYYNVLTGCVCARYRLQIKMWLKYHLLFLQNQNRLICLILDKPINHLLTLSQMEILSNCQQLLHPWEVNPNQQGSSQGCCCLPAYLQLAKTKPFLQDLSKKVHLL